MSLFALEIEGQPIMVFASEDSISAYHFAADSALQEDLMVLMYEGSPLWDGEADLFVREAHPEEASAWEIGFAKARQDGDAGENERDDHAVFLVPVSY